MSRENVEAVERLIEAWPRGDRDGWLEPAHPEIEWSSAIQREVEGEDFVYRGVEEVQRFWDDWHSLWTLDIELTEVRDLGDRVLALATIRTEGHASGLAVDRPIGYLFDFEDGLVRAVCAYLSREEALAAAGLRA